ncbi:MAG: hypothetical protein FJ304_19925 [Planctomycetes bacterium]|nr:hypothetical protein [Planctomycetota bacterium]
MSRFSPVALGALVLSLAPLSARAQDAKKAAADLQNQYGDIQKQLATGTDLQKHLRLDKFEAADDTVKVTGVFLDTPPAKGDDPVPFEQVTDELFKALRERLKMAELKFDSTGIKRLAPDQHPHVLAQAAANAAAAAGDAEADRAVYTDTHFTASGGLNIVGFKAKAGNVYGWMSKLPGTFLSDHPAYKRPNGTGAIAYNLKDVDWAVSAPQLQKVFAAAGKAGGTPDEKNQYALRRLFVARAHFVYQITKPGEKDVSVGLRFRVEGLRVGEDEVKVEWAQDATNPLVTALVGRPVPADYAGLVSGALEEPTKAFRAAVAAMPALDGVRIDPGFTFGGTGELQLAGLQPGLPEAAQLDLAAIIRAGFTAHGKGKPFAPKYDKLAARPISFKAMTVVPTAKLMADMRAWTVATKDDLKLQRLYFPDDLAAVQKRFFVESGGLVLLYRPSNAADAKDVEAEFKRLLKVHLESGVPGGPPAPPAVPPAADKEAPLPSLTAHLRKEMAGDQKKWNGVLIERGYFDEQNRYTVTGVVDAAGQNDELVKLIDGLKDDPKWADYFAPVPQKPALDVVPMSALLDRVKRVAPAYGAFDGVRIESARYDANVNLIFDAHIVGQIDRDAAPLLAKLIRENPTFKRRAPADKQVRVVRGTGPSYSDDQVGDFSLAIGAKLLAKAGASQSDRDKAKTWLDVAVLHYPNEAAVWFLSAHYHFAVAKDEELARRDLYRVVALEGPLAFNGPAQRKRRYDAAKDFQGQTRTELEALWLECFREVKDGGRPITMTPKK